jgi:tetratricopeptide (TPR) repeat protein
LKKNYLPEESADSKHSSELVTFLKESEKLNKEKINENDISLRVCIYLNKKISDKAASMGFAKLTTICSVNYKFRVTILCASKAFKLGGLENHKKFTLLRNLAAVLKSRQDYKFALRMFEWALKECGDEDKENVLDMIAAMHRCLGDVACKSKRYFEAIGYWQKASERLKNKMEKKGIETEVKQYLDEERAKLIEKIEAVKKEGNYKTANATDRVNHNDNKIWSNGTSSTFYKDSKNEENPSQLENGSLEQAHHY